MQSYLGSGVSLIDHRSGSVHDHSEIMASAGKRAEALAVAGIGSGDRVVIAHGEGASVLVDLLAVWHQGATAVIVSHAITPPEREIVLQTTAAKAWIGPDAPSGVSQFDAGSFQTGPASALASRACGGAPLITSGLWGKVERFCTGMGPPG